MVFELKHKLAYFDGKKVELVSKVDPGSERPLILYNGVLYVPLFHAGEGVGIAPVKEDPLDLIGRKDVKIIAIGTDFGDDGALCGPQGEEGVVYTPDGQAKMAEKGSD